MPPKMKNKFSKPQNIKKTLKHLFKYLKSYIPHLIIVFICIILASVFQALATSSLKNIIDLGITPYIHLGGASLSFDYLFNSVLGKYILQMALFYLIVLVSAYTNSRLMIYVSTGVMKKVRDDLFVHLESLKVQYFDTHTHGEIMSRFTNDTDALREMLSQGIPQFISGFCQIVAYFVLMITYSLPLTVIVIVALFGFFAIIKKVVGKSRNFFLASQKTLGEANGYIEEMMEGSKVVKVFTHEEKVINGFTDINERLRVATTNANQAGMILYPIMGNLSYVLYAIVGVAGGAMILLNKTYSFENPFVVWILGMTAGTLVSFLTSIRSFTMPITNMSQQINGIFTALAGSERIFNVMEVEPEEDNGYVKLVNAQIDKKGHITECEERTGIWAWKHTHGNGTITYTQLKGDVRFEDVVFGYVPGKIVLNKISLYAKPGQKIALVGSTGAGKTTITNLLNRFYDINSGKLRYDGININKIKKDDLRRSLGIVLQDTNLFTGTIMDNIRYGKLDATDEECIAAAKLANADSFITHLPDGYNTMLTGNGANLSQGQRQLLNIARAAVANPPVLILDEATSSIDTRTEAIISKGMDQLMEGRTVFVIAHRLSTIRNADAIMVLEHGEIIERGDHEDLIKQKGRYYQLYTGKAELD